MHKTLTSRSVARGATFPAQVDPASEPSPSPSDLDRRDLAATGLPTRSYRGIRLHRCDHRARRRRMIVPTSVKANSGDRVHQRAPIPARSAPPASTLELRAAPGNAVHFQFNL